VQVDDERLWLAAAVADRVVVAGHVDVVLARGAFPIHEVVVRGRPCVSTGATQGAPVRALGHQTDERGEHKAGE
jgi:hypothetical protein